jgi:uncharacterized repeat protein (TIGR01451 family)/CSLREA domain-containing protein
MSTVSRRNRRRKLAAGAAVALGAVVAPEALAATITVNSTADNTTVDGQCTLREALQNANDNAATNADCVAGTGLDTIDFSLTLPALITLDGSDLPITDTVIIDGPGQAALTISGNDLSRIFTIEDTDSATIIAVTIDDMTLTEGNASQHVPPGGGAIFNAEDLTITNVALTDNEADAGGAIYNTGCGCLVPAEMTMSNSTLTGNLSGYGGAILSDGTIATITGSDISDNASLAFGGGMLHSGGSVVLTNTTITGNIAPIVGGAAFYYLSSATLTNATVTGNTSTSAHSGGLYFYAVLNLTIEDSLISGNEAAANGGGIKIAYGGPITIRDTEISGNTAGSHGGGLYLYGPESEATLERVRIVNNTAALYGGGLTIYGMTAHVVESQISGNEAATGGGIYAGYEATLYLVNSTVANNVATTGSGGGLHINDASAFIDVSTISGNTAPGGAGGNMFLYAADLYMSHSIVANGSANAGNDLVTSNSNADIRWSLIEDTTGATFTGSDNLTGVDPQLGPLQNNGGPTETMKPAPTSPVVNSGAPEFTAPTNDQRGFPRPVGIVDRGAVELNPGTLALSSATYSINEAGTFVTITVNRTGGADGAVSVNYATSSGSAISGSDFSPASGTLNWADGDVAPQTFDIPITNDAIFEGNEQFNVTLDTVVNATLGTSAAVVTIVDNDTQPTVSISPASATEGNAGNTPANFTVTLSNPTTQTVTVDFATAGVDAISGTDFQPNSGTITFNPLVTSQPLAVQVIGDVLDEANETFTVTLTNPANATLGTATGTGTIVDDDGAATLTISDVSLAEGNAGTTNFIFNVTLAPSSGQIVTVDYATAPIDATSGVDFQPTSGTLTFNPGVTSQQIVVAVNGDALDEINERFNVNLTNNTNATVADGTGLGTILDDDASGLVISDVTLAEGNAGSTNFNFTVTLTPGSAQTVTVDYATANGTATAGSDYTATSGTLTFNPGVTSQQITVQVAGDTTVESNETFTVVLSNAPLATINDNSGTGTITNDDVLIADLSVAKAVVGTGPFVVGQNATFTITVNNAGPGSAANVHVLDTLPAGTTFVSATPSAGSCTGTITVDCNLGTLTNGGSATISLVVQLTTPGVVINNATATSDTADPTPPAGSAQITVAAAAAGEAVPTLNEWMLIALASALAAAAALKIRT